MDKRKARSFTSFMESLLPLYHQHDDHPLVYTVTHDSILKGLYCESSAFDKTVFFIWVFVQPLYCPEHEFVFNLGNRLGRVSGGTEVHFRCDDTDVYQKIEMYVRAEAESWLRKYSDALTSAAHFGQHGDDVYALRAQGYSLLWSSDKQNGLQSLDKLMGILECKRDIQWCKELYQEVRDVKCALREDEQSCVKLLKQFEEVTRKELKV